MNVLALETATGSAAVALATEDGVLAESTVRAARQHVELLHPLIEEVLGSAGLSLGELDAVGADVGPGLFTGIRVGVAAAKALAVARGVPVVGATSLAALRRGAVLAGLQEERAVPVVDLRRGEVAFLRGGEPVRGTALQLREELSGSEDLVFCGDGALRYAAQLTTGPGWSVAGEELASPPVASLAVLAVEGMLEGHSLQPAELAPLYLREADARINWTTRHDAPSERKA